MLAFKHDSLDSALEYAFYMESAMESQFRKIKCYVRLSTTPLILPRIFEKNGTSNLKTQLSGTVTRHALLDQRKGLGLCLMW
jgi:hypothetical protein